MKNYSLKTIVLLLTGTFLFLNCSNTINVNGHLKNEQEYLILEKVIPLPNVSGRIDHIAINIKKHIAYIAALGNNSVEIVDLKKGEVIRSIKNLAEPQGIIYIEESNSFFVANGGSGECDVFNATSFEKSTSLKLAGDADNVSYDTADKKIYVGYGSGGIAIIDATTFKLITEIKLSGHPESFQIDKTAKKIFVNVPDEQQIEVIDLEIKLVTDKWQLTEAKANFPMALDETNHRLFVGCRHSPKLLIIDTQTGKTISSLDIDSDVDDIFYDKNSKQIYLSCGGGYIDILKQKDANNYELVSKISTRSGARTCLLVPELKQLLLSVPSSMKKNAELHVYNIN
ncbi:MAG: YncE family protein [Bacteroidia bacterium]|nr:YncE family protein [Bacteroidia bacterium]